MSATFDHLPAGGVLWRVAAMIPKGLPAFVAVGCAGLATDLVVLWSLERLGAAPAVARVGSLAYATLMTWTLNRRVTFAPSRRIPLHELTRYAGVAVAAQGLNLLIFLRIIDLAPNLPHALAALSGAVTAAAFSYTGQRFFTFRPVGPRA
ncbi:MAG: GtrA family protein [Phenylobacterium sp.]|uniref:GtrA family protein n=1 Tax=Phenylobacterium sp. TaxID=1871053 RepID=UPI002735C197|nr:GtrA family protein [Phenylobacterium sp.]MDP3172883.1 GtrA family protein [Phenylobacterium sp.]